VLVLFVQVARVRVTEHGTAPGDFVQVKAGLEVGLAAFARVELDNGTWEVLIIN